MNERPHRQAEISQRLWNSTAEAPADPAGLTPMSVVLEQYKLYVEMADRVSQRRAWANTFFLSLNTAIITLVGVLWVNGPVEHPWWLLIPLGALLGQCIAWYYLVRSYRLLNSAKYEVVGALEERLPASPYWRAEWWALGEGNDRRRYWPLSHLEQWIPIFFACAYIGIFLINVISR